MLLPDHGETRAILWVLRASFRGRGQGAGEGQAKGGQAVIPKLGVHMTITEAEMCLGELVRRMGFEHVLRTAIAAAREEAGRNASRAERDFQVLGGVAVAAGLEKEGGDEPQA